MIRLIFAAFFLSGCTAMQDSAAVEPATEPGGMVAAANPHAVEAGLEILRQGGGAADAAVAVQTVLGLVEPQSSGLGGGGFVVYFDAASGEVSVYDGRERAPAAADERLFFDEDGELMDFMEAWTSGRAPGVPGAIDALRLAQADHGKLDWADLFASGEKLAEDGFEVSPRLHDLLVRIADYGPLDERPATRAYFYDRNGEALAAGHVLKNPDYARTLRAIADNPRALLEGPIAADIVAAAKAAPHGSQLTLEDLGGYHAQREDSVCRPYRVWLVCSAPPPSSGGVAINYALEILEDLPIGQNGPDTAAGWHYFIEAMRLSYADRDRYVADPDYVDVPVDALLDEDYLARRAALVSADTAIPHALAGNPFAGSEAYGTDTTDPTPGTSHFVVVDGDGNVVSMTTTVESAFGSHIFTDGFLLNNQLTDFAREAYDDQGRLLANAPAGGKRPRSSMSPVIVLDRETGEFVLAVGSPGGNSIIAYVLKALVGVLDWDLTPQQAIALPNVIARGDTVQIETGFDSEIAEALRQMGHDVAAPKGENSGLHAVMVTPDGLVGGADPRREGQARTP